MTPQMSKSAVDRLGKRLRAADETTAEDLKALQEFILRHSDPLASAVRVVREELGLKPAHRLKTYDTLVDKLRRPPHIQLSHVQDIAGMRVVIPGTRNDQDRAVERICAAFEGAKVTDRREQPSYGYRAVHVILKVDGLKVEVQVRTVWQNRWAQLVERLGGTWGRQIRYGQPPKEPERPLVSSVSRAQVWAMVLQLSDHIHEAEQGDAEDAELDEAAIAGEAPLNALPDLEDLVDPRIHELRVVTDQIREMRAKLWAMIDEYMDVLDHMLDELG